MSSRRRWLTCLLVVAGAGPAWGHSPPSEDTTDRYLKLTPMGDRVRLTYTVVFGRGPGARTRARLDRDRDRTVSATEADVLGAELARDVGAALTVTVDGTAAPTVWHDVDVGLGTPAVSAGALSVDLITWRCVAGPGDHVLTMSDHVALPDLGSTELTVEAGAGVTLAQVRLAGQDLPDRVATWTGRDGPLASGLELTYQVSPRAARPGDHRCDPRRASSPWPARAGAGLVVVLAGGAIGWSRRRRAGARR
ncbi:MAG: hypothetical protein R3B06_18360 [Kofleriaceae bacterium]